MISVSTLFSELFLPNHLLSGDNHEHSRNSTKYAVFIYERKSYISDCFEFYMKNKQQTQNKNSQK